MKSAHNVVRMGFDLTQHRKMAAAKDLVRAPMVAMSQEWKPNRKAASFLGHACWHVRAEGQNRINEYRERATATPSVALSAFSCLFCSKTIKNEPEEYQIQEPRSKINYLAYMCWGTLLLPECLPNLVVGTRPIPQNNGYMEVLSNT